MEQLKSYLGNQGAISISSLLRRSGTKTEDRMAMSPGGNRYGRTKCMRSLIFIDIKDGILKLKLKIAHKETFTNVNEYHMGRYRSAIEKLEKIVASEKRLKRRFK